MEVVAGVRVTTATEEGFAVALTNTGDVYSWGKSYRCRLGHSTADNQKTPKLVEALAGKDCKQVSVVVEVITHSLILPTSLTFPLSLPTAFTPLSLFLLSLSSSLSPSPLFPGGYV